MRQVCSRRPEACGRRRRQECCEDQCTPAAERSASSGPAACPRSGALRRCSDRRGRRADRLPSPPAPSDVPGTGRPEGRPPNRGPPAATNRNLCETWYRPSDETGREPAPESSRRRRLRSLTPTPVQVTDVLVGAAILEL